MSGAILLAASGGLPNINAANMAAEILTGTTSAVVGVEIDNDGTIDINNDGSPQDGGDWMQPPLSSLSSLYEVKFEQSAGSTLDVASAALSTWHACSTDRLLQLTQSGIGSKSANGTYIIRLASSTAELDNGTWSLTVQVTS